MSGLVKPVTQRGRPAVRRARNPAISTGAAAGGSRSSPFVSSYRDDKERKRKQQMKDRLRTYLLFSVIGMAIFLVAKMRSRDKSSAQLRSGTAQSSSGVQSVKLPPAPAAAAPKPKEPLAKCIPVNNPVKDISGGHTVSLVEGSKDTICGRKIPKPLEDHPAFSPLGPMMMPAGSKEAVLVKRDPGFGGMGNMITCFFHAYDMAYESNMPLYITQDSWVFSTLFPLFFGPSSAVEKNSQLWAAVQETLGVRVVENPGVLDASGVKVPKAAPPNGLFWVHADVEPAKFRDHRSAILRKLLRFPSTQGRPDENVCATIQALLGNDREKKYAVVSPYVDQTWLDKLNGASGRDNTMAAEVRPDYVKNILKRLDMLGNDIYPVGGDAAYHDQMARDPELGENFKCVRDPLYGHEGGNVYLSLMADVYIGSPVDQMNLWVARMRCALGMKNTFVFTKKKEGQWVSIMDDDDCLELYEKNRLGPFMG